MRTYIPEDKNKPTFSAFNMLRMCTEKDSLHDGREMFWLSISEDVEPVEIGSQQQGIGKYELCHQVVRTTYAFVDMSSNQRLLSVTVTEEHWLQRRRG